MSQEDPNAARRIFWRTPELVEKLVNFLDVESALLLAQSHELALKLVQEPSKWKKLIRQSGLRSKVTEEKSQEAPNVGLLATHKEKLKNRVFRNLPFS